jgi:glyceraldehyde-3-phosphate dehydrogenase (NAD(P))
MTAKKNVVHVVGTGTIGEPLIGLFNQFKERWGIDEVTFHKRTPAANDRAKVNQLIEHGARLATDEDARADFAELGHRVSYEAEEAIERAAVVVDCTPAGNENKTKYYERSKGPKGFLAQGSEFGFGRPASTTRSAVPINVSCRWCPATRTTFPFFSRRSGGRMESRI